MVAAVAASGSVTRAASEVHLTQSAVSHQLRDIEDRLGTALFLRVGKRMVPTAAGERVLSTARRVLDDITTAEDDVRRLGTNKAGVLRVCAQCNTGYHWLPPLVEAFRRKHPHVDVVIAVECTMRPLEALLDGRLDLAIVTRGRPQPPPAGAARCSKTSMRRSSRPIIPSRHARSCAPKTSPTERLLLYSGSADDSFTIQKILRPAGVEPERISFVMLTEAILAMVKARLGISVMQTWAVEPAIRAGDVRAIPITPTGIHRRWSAATLRAAPSSPRDGRLSRSSRRPRHAGAQTPPPAGAPADQALRLRR